MKAVTAAAPAKLILSGEHAVVYGAPAIAVALQCYAKTTVSATAQGGVHFHLPNLDYTKTVTVKTLRGLKNRLKEKYLRFSQGQAHVRDILSTPFELAQFAMINTADYIKTSLKDLSIHTDSAIPNGCGLGSSAATSLSVIFALAKYSNSSMQTEDYIELGQAAEKLQHGYPSGLDVQTILRGGCLMWHQGQAMPLAIELPKILLVNTGKPAVTTGVTVQAVRERFHDSAIWGEFTKATNQMKQALEVDSLDSLQEAITLNQQCLQEIGVVPDKVVRFIDELAKLDCAAKICGAGASEGEAAGMCWCVARGDVDAIKTIVEKHGYTWQEYQVEPRGVHYA